MLNDKPKSIFPINAVIAIICALLIIFSFLNSGPPTISPLICLFFIIGIVSVVLSFRKETLSAAIVATIMLLIALLPLNTYPLYDKIMGNPDPRSLLCRGSEEFYCMESQEVRINDNQLRIDIVLTNRLPSTVILDKAPTAISAKSSYGAAWSGAPPNQNCAFNSSVVAGGAYVLLSCNITSTVILPFGYSYSYDTHTNYTKIPVEFTFRYAKEAGQEFSIAKGELNLGWIYQ